jgi:hypothetical protein
MTGRGGRGIRGAMRRLRQVPSTEYQAILRIFDNPPSRTAVTKPVTPSNKPCCIIDTPPSTVYCLPDRTPKGDATKCMNR